MVDSPASFIFGGDTGTSYDELKRRRDIAAALASRSRPFPKTLGEGLTYFGESMGEVLADRRVRQMEAAQRAKESSIVGGGPPASFTPPIGGTKSSSWVDDGTPSPAAAAGAVAPVVAPPPQPTTSASGAVNPPVADKPAMSKVGDAIGRLEPDPVMRTYLTNLAGREDPSGGQQVSPTGAAGPFQFTRGTGAQYGLVGPDGDRRTDVDASVTAAQQLTRDNAQAFMKINNRAPTLSELALMHQQGGVTGARMVAGIGNAPARNLAVNNIDPSLGPQDAAAQIQAYYKMPDAKMPEDYVGGGREGVTRALVAPQAAAPEAPAQVASLDPAVGVNAVAPREAANNPPITSDIKSAPTQVAQAGALPSLEPIPGASVQEMTHPGAPPTRPPILGPSKAQAYWSQFMNNPRYSPELQAEATRRYNTEEAYRKEIETRQTGDYENTRGQYQKHKDEYDKFVREAPDRVLKQLIDRTGLEAARSKLEQDYYDKGLPRVQAARKAALEILQGERTLNKPDSVGAQGTHFERPYAPPGSPQGTFAVPAGLPPPEDKPLTEQQAKGVQFVVRVKPDLDMVDHELRYGKVLTDPVEAARASVPVVGNLTMSNEYRRAHNALTNWGAAFLTHVSGAAVSPSEAGRNLPAFMPHAGDTDQDLLDKANRRRTFTEALARTSGREGLAAIQKEVGTLNDDYAFKKISEGPPVQVKSLNDARLLPPGQRLILPDGSSGQVPRRQKRGE